MFHFPGCPSHRLWIHLWMTAHYHGRVSPFGYPGITAYLQLPRAFRSLSRPSSAISALASTLRSYSLDLASFASVTLLRLLRGDFRFLFRFVLPVQFSRCGGQSPLPFAAARSSPPDRPSNGLPSAWRSSTLELFDLPALRFLANPQNDTEMIQSERFRLAFAWL